MNDAFSTGLAPDFLARVALFFHSFPGGDKLFMVLAFALVLGILIFVHEYGHYRAALSVGIKVQAFSIGFGRALFKWVDKRGTAWQVAWIPLGGYVQMLGMDDMDPTAVVKAPGSYQTKNILQRAWVIAAGPLANLVFAFLLLCVVMLTGEQKLKAEVGAIQPDMPAMGKVLVGDEIVAMNGVSVGDWDAFMQAVQANMGAPVRLDVMRAGAKVQLDMAPRVVVFKDLLGTTHTVGRIGIAPSGKRFIVKHAPVEAVVVAAERSWELLDLTVVSLGKLMIGAIAPSNLTGPLGIADMAGQTASAGLFAVMMFMVIISVNLGVVNLIPLPVLDGGHLFFLLVEAIRGRPVSVRVLDYASRAGLALIICLAVFATLNDVNRMGILDKIVGSVSAKAEGGSPRSISVH